MALFETLVSSTLPTQHPAPQDALSANKSFQAALTPGRIVLYAHPTNGLTEPAVVLGDAPPAPTSSSTSSLSPASPTSSPTPPGASAPTPDRRLYLLVLHRPGAADAAHEAAEAERRAKEGGAAGGTAGGAGAGGGGGLGGMVAMQSRKQQELDGGCSAHVTKRHSQEACFVCQLPVCWLEPGGGRGEGEGWQ